MRKKLDAEINKAFEDAKIRLDTLRGIVKIDLLGHVRFLFLVSRLFLRNFTIKQISIELSVSCNQSP